MKPILWLQKTPNDEELNNLLTHKPLLGGVVCPILLDGDPGGWIGFKGQVGDSLGYVRKIQNLCSALSTERVRCKLYKQLWCFTNNTAVPELNRYAHNLLPEYEENAKRVLQEVDDYIGDRVPNNYLLDTEIYIMNNGVWDLLGWADVEGARASACAKIFRYKPDVYAWLGQLYPQDNQKNRHPLPGWWKYSVTLKALPLKYNTKPQGFFLDFSSANIKQRHIGIGNKLPELGYEVVGGCWRNWKEQRNPSNTLLAECNRAYSLKISPYIYDEHNYFATREGAKILASVCGKVKKG